MNRPLFARVIAKRLNDAVPLTPDPDVRVALLSAASFLYTRLTEAAIDGCHHCNEVAPPAPCRWCGLLGTAEPPDAPPPKRAVCLKCNASYTWVGDLPPLFGAFYYCDCGGILDRCR
jgi:hypothetical protein